MRYQNTQDLYDTHIIFELLACLTPDFQVHYLEHVLSKDMKILHENVLSKEILVLDLPTNYRTSFVDVAKAKLFFIYVACFVDSVD